MLRPFCRTAALVVVCLPFVASAQQVPCKATVVGRLDIVPLTSRVFHNTRNLRVWLPPGFDPAKKYPVLYILDGASAFDVCASYNHEEMHADETLTELITSDKIPPLIAVGIDNGSDAIHHGDGNGNARAANFCRIRTPITQVPLPLPELGILTFLSLKSCQSSPRSTRSRPVPSIPPSGRRPTAASPRFTL